MKREEAVKSVIDTMNRQANLQWALCEFRYGKLGNKEFYHNEFTKTAIKTRALNKKIVLFLDDACFPDALSDVLKNNSFSPEAVILCSIAYDLLFNSDYVFAHVNEQLFLIKARTVLV